MPTARFQIDRLYEALVHEPQRFVHSVALPSVRAQHTSFDRTPSQGCTAYGQIQGAVFVQPGMVYGQIRTSVFVHSVALPSVRAAVDPSTALRKKGVRAT